MKNLKKTMSIYIVNQNGKVLNKKPKLIKLIDSNNISTTKIKNDKKYNLVFDIFNNIMKNKNNCKNQDN